jgi:hypothetical protein
MDETEKQSIQSSIENDETGNICDAYVLEPDNQIADMIRAELKKRNEL